MKIAHVVGLLTVILVLTILIVLLRYEDAETPGIPQATDGGNLQGTETVIPETANANEPARAPRREGESGLDIELADLSGFNIGDELELFIPQENRSHRGRVNDMEITASGNRVLKGVFDSGHRFIFTVGRLQTFGTIRTESGQYQLETRDGSGRIISLAAINEKLDFTKPDYVIPGRIDVPPEEGERGN